MAMTIRGAFAIFCLVGELPVGLAKGFLAPLAGEGNSTSPEVASALDSVSLSTPTNATNHTDALADLVGDDRWVAAAANSSLSLAGYSQPPSPGQFGFPYIATTTRYGTNPFTACDMDSAALVAGTDYLPVASAQAMQDKFPAGGCCRCGESTSSGASTAGMGCGTCGKGRFVRQLPRGFYIWTPSDAQIFQKEYDIVVVDICPKSQNGMWCPSTPGTTNTFGVHNHFDFAIVPQHFDNFYFAFQPAPCSPEMEARIQRMSSCVR
mmetsp:Transcript_15982/g.34591  ORF Transcript_15982/g.34591 Transcript_15982/m.34591 type:complete len:265 (+) Transcript_15982:174-968(+)